MVRIQLIANSLFVASLFLNLAAGSGPLPNPGSKPMALTQTQEEPPMTVCESPKYNDSEATKRTKYICEMETYLPLTQGALEMTGASEAEQNQTLAQIRKEISERYMSLTDKWLKKMTYCHNIASNKKNAKALLENLKKTNKNDAELVKTTLKVKSKKMLDDDKLLTVLVDFSNKIRISRNLQNAWSWVPGSSCSSKK